MASSFWPSSQGITNLTLNPRRRIIVSHVQEIAAKCDNRCNCAGRIVCRRTRANEDHNGAIALCSAQSLVRIVGFDDLHARVDRNAIAAQKDQSPHNRVIGRGDEKV